MFISVANILRLVFCHELLSLACEINANIPLLPLRGTEVQNIN